MQGYHSGEAIKRLVSYDIAGQMELEIYRLQCEENYQLDSKKLELDDNTIIIMGSIDNDLFRKKVKIAIFSEPSC